MSFPAYPEYRDSGVAWAASIPKHWNEERLASLFDIQKREVEPDHEVVTAFRDGQVTLRSNRREDGFTFATKEIGYQGVSAGDLVIHAMDAFAGAIGVSDSEGKSTPVYSVCQPKEGVDAHFYALLLRTMALAGFVESLAKGVRERSTDFRWRDARDVRVPVPPLPEQRAIAALLDRETAKIDAAVAAQERLIALLAEKRAATISHAVTKGLDAQAPMKDSGIEWLGQIPAHWDAVQLRHWGSFGAGSGFPHEFQGQSGNDYPFHKVGSLAGADDEGVIRESPNTVSAETAGALRATIFPEGTIVYAKIGAALLLGRIRMLGQPSCIDNNMAAFTAGPEVLKNYARYAFELVRFDLLVNPGAVPSLSESAMKALKLPLPPLSEQGEICASIASANREFDSATALATNAVRLLKERRAALISAAVTGKIDVRGQAAGAALEEAA